MRVEEEFENVMANIEIQVVSVAGKNPEMIDAGVDKVYNAFLSKYKALLRGKKARKVSYAFPEQELYRLIEDMCDFFTGDSESWGDGQFFIELDAEKVSYKTLVAIFKRLRKSLKTWTKRGGRKGYIYYLTHFFSEFSDGQHSENSVIDSYIEAGLENINSTRKLT